VVDVLFWNYIGFGYAALRKGLLVAAGVAPLLKLVGPEGAAFKNGLLVGAEVVELFADKNGFTAVGTDVGF
jgi:hypothetical protein